MLISYKYSLSPDESQKAVLQKIFGCTRFIYNLGLETRKTVYASAQKTLSVVELINELPGLKEDLPWLKECPSQALQGSLRNLDTAYQRFFKGGGFPRFKNKHSKQSFQLPQGVKVDTAGGMVFLPKLGWVRCVFHRGLKGDIKTVTVTKTATGKYFVSILVDNQTRVAAKKPVMESSAVGIDFGITRFLTLSDGAIYGNQRLLRQSLGKLRVAQRTLSRRYKKGAGEQSRGYLRQRMVVARLHERIANQRRDYLHKVSTELIHKYDTICLEDLNIRGMMQNRKLSRSIGEVGWNQFEVYLRYKAEWYGKNLAYIGRYEPSSKRCSECGWINETLTLKERSWTCGSCKSVHDRDINAAVNIKRLGLRNEPISAKPALAGLGMKLSASSR